MLCVAGSRRSFLLLKKIKAETASFKCENPPILKSGDS